MTAGEAGALTRRQRKQGREGLRHHTIDGTISVLESPLALRDLSQCHVFLAPLDPTRRVGQGEHRAADARDGGRHEKQEASEA